MCDHWREFGRPAHIQLAAFFGTAKPKRPVEQGDLEADFGGTGGSF